VTLEYAQELLMRALSNMIRRGTSPVILRAAAVLAGASFAGAMQSPTVNGRSLPPVADSAISVSAVSHSDNCDRISQLAEQLQRSADGRNLQLIQGPERSTPLSGSGKFRLAVKNFSDPLNIAGTALDSAISTATSSSQSAFGTGWPGFGRRFGMSMSDAALSEFFSTYLVSTLAHQDPHYHRNPSSSTGKRIAYALSRVVISRSDSGKPMFNFAEFVGTTASSLVESSYHFERDENPGAVSSRIFVSIGSDAGWNLMNEFLPDIAKHLNPRFIFLRRLAERAAKQN
jgi:hypothetical protein